MFSFFLLYLAYLQNIAVNFNGNTVDDAFDKRPDEAYVKAALFSIGCINFILSDYKIAS